MRYRFLFLLLLLSLSACTFQADVLTPQPLVDPDSRTATPPPFPTFTFTPETSELGTLTATPLPYPTFTLTPTITPSPLPRNIGTVPIQFDPNGTYVDVVDTILAGTSKTYSISASKGQIMSISIHQGWEGDWVYIPMQITGADGTVLCPPLENTECEFWRGALPATQDYFVKVMPVNDIMDFTLRVAINPPGIATQAFQFMSLKQNASLSYHDDFAPVRFPGPLVYKVEPELVLELIDSPFYVNTNLVEAYLLYGSTDESGVVADCTQPVSYGGEENVVGDVNINGNTFVHSEGAGVGAGNVYEQIYHRAVIKGYCYEVTFFFHYGNIGNYAPDAGIKEFDRAALLQRFEAILSTLSLKQ